MSSGKTLTLLSHRRSSIFIDEFVDRYSAMAISWNGEERIHITFGRDSVEVINERLIQSPKDPAKAELDVNETLAYRNDVAALTMPVDVAEKLAITILKMVSHAKAREKAESDR